MSEEFGIRDDINQDVQDTKDSLGKVARPIIDKAEDEIGERVQREIADKIAQAAQNAAGKAAAETAASAAAGAGAEAAAGSIATTGGGAATTAAAETAAGAGTSIAAGEAAASAGGAVASGAAAGSVAPGIGTIIGAVVGVLIEAAKAVKKETDISLDKDDPNGPKLNAFVIILIAVAFFLVAVCGTLISKGTVSSLSIAQETEFQNTKVDGGNMSEAGKHYEEGYDTPDFDDEKPLKNGISWFVYGGGDGTGEDAGIRGSLHAALCKHCRNIIANLEDYKGKVRNKKYDHKRSLESFYENQWPYDLATADFTPKIGNVFWVQAEADIEKSYDEYHARYNDVNYAEILSIFGMSADAPQGAQYGLHWGEINYNDFMEYLKKEECYKYMYELGLKWVPIYEGEKVIPRYDEEGNWLYNDYETIEHDGGDYSSAEDCDANAPETIIVDGITCTFTSYYVKVTVKPFGLRELFAMAFNTTEFYAASQQKHVDFDQHTNIDILDYQERVTRLYQRDYKRVIAGEEYDALGPTFKEPRSKYSSIYNELINDDWLQKREQAGTGRSAWYYIEETFNDELGIIEYENELPNIDDEEYKKWIEELGIDADILLEIIKFLQGDEPWGSYRLYDKDGIIKTIASSGCGFTSMAMIASYFTGKTITPDQIGEQFKSYYVPNEGMSHALPDAVAKAFGFKTDINGASGFDAKTVIEELQAGHPVLVSFHNGKFTKGGHLTVIVGVTEDGDFIVNDPSGNNNKNYGNVYSAEDMKDNVAHYWSFEEG